MINEIAPRGSSGDDGYGSAREHLNDPLLQEIYYALDRTHTVKGFLNLSDLEIKHLGNVEHVKGSLFLSRTPIESLGKLRRVDEHLYLHEANIKSLGNLEYVGGDLVIYDTPLVDRYTKREIKRKVKIGGYLIYDWKDATRKEIWNRIKKFWK